MQAFTDADRRTLTARGATIDFGCDVLDENGTVIDSFAPNWVVDPKDPDKRIPDPSSDLLGGTITHMGYADVHRKCEIRMTRELDPHAAELQPWQSVTAFGHTVRAPQGVFRLTRPELTMGTEPLIRTITGADRLSLMMDAMGDTETSALGSVVQDEISATIADALVPGGVIVDSTLRDVILDHDMTWVYDIQNADSYLRRANDLLAAVAGRSLYMDSNGDFHVNPYRPPSVRASEWFFDLTNPKTDIVKIERSSSTNGWTRYNEWRFVRENLPYEPVDGDGLYVIPAPVGVRPVRHSASIAAADQASLISQGNQIRDTDLAVVQTIDINAVGFPILEHFDVADYLDPQLSASVLKVQIRNWTNTLETGDVAITLEVPSG